MKENNEKTWLVLLGHSTILEETTFMMNTAERKIRRHQQREGTFVPESHSP